MRTLLLALAAPFISAQLLEGTPAMVQAAPNNTQSHMEDDKFLDDQELIISVGTYPCVFKVGDSFYDYTPFKLAASD